MLRNLVGRFLEIKNEEGLVSALQSIQRFVLDHLTPKRPRIHPLVRWIYIRNKSYSDAEPEKLVYIDPNQVKSELLSTIGYDLLERGLVCDGRWDKAGSGFHDRYQVYSLRRHFKEGVPWTETEYYNRRTLTVRTGGWRGCSSEDDVLKFLNRFDDLYVQIQREGYKTQAELMDINPQQTKRLNNDAERPELNEIGITIGRDGELLWQYGGQHRLAIAQLLELDEVPAYVYARHREWQNIRDKVRKSKRTEDLSQDLKEHIDHPDLLDIRPEL